MKVKNLIITVLFMLFINFTQAKDVTASDQLVKQLESNYAKFHQAGISGDLEAWLNTRTEKFAAQIRSMKPAPTGDMLKAGAAQDSDLNEFEFVKIDRADKVARLLYKKPADDAIVMIALMFHEENNDWKVGHSSEMTCAGDLAKDLAACEESFLKNPRLQMNQ